MGILSGKDLLSGKYTTAIITDASNHMYFVPIKFVLGDFFLAEIDHQIYCFKLDSSREKTYRHKGVRSFKVLMYDTNHYLPISPENNTELEDFLRENRLPRVNNMMLRALHHLSKRESHNKKDFQPHDIKQLFDAISDEDGDYSKEIKNFQTFFKNLQVTQIVRPTKKISEFLIDDLLTTSPQFHGNVLKQVELTDEVHKKVTNQPKTGKTNWMLIGILLGIVVMLAVVILYFNSQGAFSHLLPSLPSIGPTLPGSTGGGTLSMDTLSKTYPTPKSLVDAIHSSELSCKQLPPDVIKMVNNPTGGGVLGTCP